MKVKIINNKKAVVIEQRGEQYVLRVKGKILTPHVFDVLETALDYAGKILRGEAV